ncbi:hypothetical protein WSK_1855 [Novosphingobium sp. Rr 2-17]|uniref:YceI family protein n=1 Tax=Novosphingobium sp. Rr 2-17 TaxID=555793 RepID=UPI0002697B42|nr:YceI family protein [Novosphingobium sp. Rr 2-17]EIZ79521.1 hypothetical protein WSK_1855 [Novosphingobium sp. Rr 2-17]
MRKAIMLSGMLAASGLVGAHLWAQSPPPGGAPAGMKPPVSSKDPKAAPAGHYSVDHEHSSVIARVSHSGFSYNVVRFAVADGELDWNPLKPDAIKLDVTVNTKPYNAPIEYKMPIEGPGMLNVAAFPTAKFVSTGVKPMGGNKADVMGQLTLWGVTRPAVIHAELVGAGTGMGGKTVTGFTGTMTFDSSEFKEQKPMSLGKITLVLDAEFHKS